jgi:hypothetical protein
MEELFIELLEEYLDAVQRDDYFDHSTLDELRKEWLDKLEVCKINSPANDEGE